MPNISGSFSAYVRAETTLFPEDQPNHQLQLSEIHATQKSPDPSWNQARLTYCGIADLVSGKTLALKEYEEGTVACPHCGSDDVEQRLSSFYEVTSKKSA